MTRVTVQQCEKVIGVPASRWPGRCHEIAGLILVAGLVRGRLVYGHWTGPIAAGSYFADRRDLPFVRHGWVVTDDEARAVFDPTRWVFEAAEPYLYVGKPPEDGEGWPYDEGGERLRREMVSIMPPGGDGPIRLGLRKAVRDRLRLPAAVSTEQALWLANLPLSQLGRDASHVYGALTRAGLRAFIPYDNRLRVAATATKRRRRSA